MMETSIAKSSRLAFSPNAPNGTARAKIITRFASLRSLVCGTRAAGIETQIEPELWKCFQCESEQHAIFFLAGVIAYDSADRGDPIGEIAIKHVALLFKRAGFFFVLFLNAHGPVIIEPVVSAHDEQAAAGKEWVLV